MEEIKGVLLQTSENKGEPPYHRSIETMINYEREGTYDKFLKFFWCRQISSSMEDESRMEPNLCRDFFFCIFKCAMS